MAVSRTESELENCRQGRAGKVLVAAALAALSLLASCTTEAPKPPMPEPQPPPPKILAFYPGQPAVAPGDQVQVCYGVENAQSVRLEPPVAEIRPLTNKCIWFKPAGSMKLTLIAAGTSGEEARATIDIAVKAGAPPSTSTASPGESTLIETFVATSTRIARGSQTTLCYVLREPASVQLDPPSGDLGSELRKCVLVGPTRTRKFTLTATAGDKRDSVSVTIQVE